MCFNEKYEMYLEDLQEGIINKEELEIKLRGNLNKSLENLYSNLNDENIKYLINELLEDKEHLDAFLLAVTVKRPE